jgi:hypothetical protein
MVDGFMWGLNHDLGLQKRFMLIVNLGCLVWCAGRNSLENVEGSCTRVCVSLLYSFKVSMAMSEALRDVFG